MCHSTFGWSPLILPFFVGKEECHVSFIHHGEVVLELVTELEPRLLIVVVLDRFRSKFQDFCDVLSSSCHRGSATMRKFCLRCDTVDDSGVSTQRDDDEDKCAK